MSKISKAVKRFDAVKVGMDERLLNAEGTPIGVDNRISIRCFGLNGKETEQLFDLIERTTFESTDENKARQKDLMRFIVLTTLKKDDATTTDSDYDDMDMSDILAISNTTAVQSGLGRMFEMEKKSQDSVSQTQTLSEENSETLDLTDLRSRLATDR